MITKHNEFVYGTLLIAEIELESVYLVNQHEMSTYVAIVSTRNHSLFHLFETLFLGSIGTPMYRKPQVQTYEKNPLVEIVS